MFFFKLTLFLETVHSRRDDSTDKEEDGETCSSRCTVTPTETDESSKKLVPKPQSTQSNYSLS